MIIGTSSRILKNTHLTGKTHIGNNCEIGPNTYLRDCEVMDNCRIGRGFWVNQIFQEGSIASDRLAVEHKYFRKPPFMIPTEPKFCFTLMPYNERHFSLYNNIIKPVLEKKGFTCRLAADKQEIGIVTDDIWNDINRASLIIAEISESNRNVWYELGLAHALNKYVVLLMRKDKSKELPFDLSNHRVLFYDPDQFDVERQFEGWLEDTLK